MITKQIWVNLGVEDVARSAEFYLALGIKPNGAATADLASFLFAENNLVIHFFRKPKLASAFGIHADQLSSGHEVMFSLSANSAEEVYEWMRLAESAGGSVFREPSRDDDGFLYGGFADPDGHKFNVLLVEPVM